MAQHGHDLSREELADAMGVVAADNRWQIEQTSDNLIQVLPIAEPGGR